MINKKLARMVFGSTFLAAMIVPAMAFAQEAAPKVDPSVGVARAIAAGASMMFSAMACAYAQARIGAAGAATLAERPEVGTNIIVLQALPETIVLIGCVIAFMI